MSLSCFAKQPLAAANSRIRGRSSIQPLVSNGRRSTTTCAFFDNFFEKPKAAAPPPKVVRPTVIPAASYNLPLGLFAIAGAEFAGDLTGLAAFTAFLGVFLSVQATRIRFRFDDEGLEVIRAGEETKNVFVGGANKWSYDSFINWELWWPGFPILTYFKENQTRPEGQIHFFPIIFNGKELYDVMVERCGPSATSGPKNALQEDDE